MWVHVPTELGPCNYAVVVVVLVAEYFFVHWLVVILKECLEFLPSYLPVAVEVKFGKQISIVDSFLSRSQVHAAIVGGLSLRAGKFFPRNDAVAVGIFRFKEARLWHALCHHFEVVVELDTRDRPTVISVHLDENVGLESRIFTFGSTEFIEIDESVSIFVLLSRTVFVMHNAAATRNTRQDAKPPQITQRLQARQ